jgi:hypothetical protein
MLSLSGLGIGITTAPFELLGNSPDNEMFFNMLRRAQNGSNSRD